MIICYQHLSPEQQAAVHQWLDLEEFEILYGWYEVTDDIVELVEPGYWQ